MLKHFALAVIGSAVLAGPVLAETAPAPNGGQFVTQEKAGQWRASKLKGLNVYNNNNEKIGDINELLVDSTGKIEAVVIGVGGFLGLGEHDVAVPFGQIKFTNESRREAKKDDAQKKPADTTASTNTSSTVGADANRAAPDHAVLNATKDQLKAAPQFKYAR
ncbi:PRC-barrel domain-containing protein [Methylobacterium durans]|uniref:Photosystem reaction center subunit H n=1 Tax=Methylobacterium durans TaxID=2202825 RepID=A0A2U8WGR0_9HYPH|nr:PRC-barrel domain-containing protein [Methylobacterium durans]AWN44728.1 photosystem reaction center subunit H [Methylobacterium durans]